MPCGLDAQIDARISRCDLLRNRARLGLCGARALDRLIDQNEKRAIYAKEGVSCLWIVDPAARMLEGFALRDGHWVLLATLADDGQVTLPPFDAFCSSRDVLWPECAAAGGDETGSSVDKVDASTGNSSTRVVQTMRRLYRET